MLLAWNLLEVSSKFEVECKASNLINAFIAMITDNW